MPLAPKRKRGRKKTNFVDDKLFEAAYAEIINGKSVRKAANMYGIKYLSLQQYKKEHLPANFPVKKGQTGKCFFTLYQEDVLKNELEKYAEIYPGLCMKIVRKFASEFAHRLGMQRPKSWVANGMAGMDWYKNFMYKNREFEKKITTTTAEDKVKVFFDRLWSIFVRYNICSENIYAIAEIGVNIEEFRDKIWLITTQNGPVALQGSQVRFTYAANAKGYAEPPLFFVPPDAIPPVSLPQKEGEDIKFSQEVKIENISGNPNETTFHVPLKNDADLKHVPHLTTDSDLIVFLKHFKKYFKTSTGPKLLLMIENQTFHLTIECMEYCRVNDIILLVIPSYFSHNIEPLAPITVILKETITTLYNTLVLEKPDEKKSIYNIPTMVSKGLLECLRPSRIQESFKNAGIFPYNREVINNTLEGDSLE